MKVIVRPRQCGKTEELLQWAHEKNALIVCHNHQEAERLWKIIVDRGWAGKTHTYMSTHGEMPKPISWGSLPSSVCSMSYEAVAVDNVDLWLKSFLADKGLLPIAPLVGLTLSGVPEVDYNQNRDTDLWLEFQKTNPSLTYQEFCKCKYGKDWINGS